MVHIFIMKTKIMLLYLNNICVYAHFLKFIFGFYVLTDGSFFKSKTEGRERRPRIFGNP